MGKVVYFNGQFVPDEKAVIPVTTHALHYGTGCYEGIRAYINAEEKCLYAFRVEDHFERFEKSCEVMHIKLPYSARKLTSIVLELLKKNFAETDIYIRPIAFKSDPAIGNFDLSKIKDSLAIYCIPLGRHYQDGKGLKVNISSWVRVSDNMIPPRAKITGSYANSCLAKTESALLGFDETIFLTKNGLVSEGSTENIFLVKNGKIYTPSENNDILAGVTRDTIIKICTRELNIGVFEKNISIKELLDADGVFFSGTGAEIAGVSEIDGRKIGGGKVSPVTEKIKKLYFDIVHGKNPKYRKWLTKVTKP